MRLSELDFDLPEELIAQTPLADRAASRLLHLERASGAVTHLAFRDVPQILREGDLLVVNDTRVDAVRLRARRTTGGLMEVLLVEETAPGAWHALARGARKLSPGEVLGFDGSSATAVVAGRAGEFVRLEFPAGLPEGGETPLPPYIRERLADAERYQTVFSAHDGSAAAPTAGLHFTPEILSGLAGAGVGLARVTLHVGVDTFRPLETEDLTEHRMHGERAVVSPETAEAVARATGRIVAVGTTSVRTLEAFATGPRRLEAGARRVDPFIRPGWEWRVVDGMFTNFHLPRTTMLAMLSALAGRDAVMAAYAEAIRERYRWASFGDAMLIV